jgi:diguanylate cyclase (GGDEF)-like protein
MTTSRGSKDCTGTVLVVDDDPTIRLLVSSVLSDAGYTVLDANNGSEALEMFAEKDVDCIVTDVNMPKMNGFELSTIVRVMPGGGRVQILFMTGNDDYDSIQKAFDAGANDFTLKHSNPLLLLERVRFLFKSQRIQDDLRLSDQRLSYAQRLASLGHWERSPDGKTIAVSDVVCQMMGIDNPQDLTWDLLCEITHPDDQPAMQATMQRAITQRTNFRLEHRIVTKRGIQRTLRHQGEIVSTNNLDGDVVIRSTVQDVTEARAQEDRIRFMAFHDPVTALPNREAATQTLKRAIDRGAERHEHVAVFALWLDDFNRVASSLGQAVSDAVLKSMGNRLRSQMRNPERPPLGGTDDDSPNFIVARADGDKFLCIVSHLAASESALTIAARLQEAVASPLNMGDTNLQLSASVGVSLYPEDGNAANSLIDNALGALLHTKGQKGACQFFADEISSRAKQRLTLETELRHAIESNQFELHYQPRMRLADHAVPGAEALLRWRHPTRGLVMPGEFIQLVEEIGLIAPLGNRVIEMVARQAAHWRQRFNQAFRLSFNISPLQFGNVNLVEEIDKAVAVAGAHYANLEVEITESVLMSRPDTVITTLNAFRERGLRIALDDFGTGFSSLSYLRRLPLDALKIDRTFVSDIGVTQSAGALVNSILSMAHALGLSSVAEGVEQETQLHFLSANHCHEIQGYLISKPMAPADMEDWFDNWEGARLDSLIA